MTGDKRSISQSNNDDKANERRVEAKKDTSSQGGKRREPLRIITRTEGAKIISSKGVLKGKAILEAIGNMNWQSQDANTDSSSSHDKQEATAGTRLSSPIGTDSPRRPGFAADIDPDDPFAPKPDSPLGFLADPESWDKEKFNGYRIRDEKSGLEVWKADVKKGKEIQKEEDVIEVTNDSQEQKLSKREVVEAFVKAEMEKRALEKWPNIAGKELFCYYKYGYLGACVKDNVVYITDNDLRLSTETFGLTPHHLKAARKGAYANGLVVLDNVEQAYDHPESNNGTNIEVKLFHAMDHPILEYVGEDKEKQGIHIISHVNSFKYIQEDSEEAKQLLNYLAASGRKTPPDSGNWIKLEDKDTYEWEDNKWEKKLFRLYREMLRGQSE